MAVPHFIKVFDYMYKLMKRNFQAYTRPAVIPKREDIPENSVHWVGHATTVINLGGTIIVTDPVAGNLGFIKRLVKPSLDLKEINADYLLLSHGHMDHLSYSTLIHMNKQAVVIAPKGIKVMLKIIGFRNIVEMTAGESYADALLRIEGISAEHEGNRYPGFGNKDSNSYLISCKGKSVLFAGDTADTAVYKGIKADAAIMPVGCYKPDEFQKMHCSPEQSFYMFKMMDCNLMIPVHYRTYILAQDKDADTIKTLKKLNDGSIEIIDIGQTVTIK